MTNRNALVTAAVLLTVFLAGALVGAAVASSVGSAGEPPDGAAAREHREEGPGDRAGGADGPDGEERGRAEDEEDRTERRRGPDFAVSRLLHEEMDLSADQERRVEAILEKRRERVHEIFDETKSRLKSQFDSAVTEIEEVLTQPQAARFDTLLQQLKERRGWTDDRDDASPRGDPDGGPEGGR